MKLAPIGSNVQTQVQTNGIIKSGFGRQPDFNQYLKKTGTEGIKLPVQAPADMDAQEINAMAGQMWGTAYDPKTQSLNFDQFAANTQTATDQFARKLGGLFRAEGIDTNAPINLEIAQDGSVRVAGNHPQKAQIESYFFTNPSLAEEFRQISGDNDNVAISKISAEFNKRMQAATTASKRQSLQTYFSGMISQAKSLTGQMSLSMDMLNSASLSYASKVVNG